MGATAFALPPFEVAIAGRCASFTGRELIGVHPEAHRTPGGAPLESSVTENAIQPFGLGLRFDAHRSGNDHRPHPLSNRAPLNHRSSQSQILDPAVRAGTDEHRIDGDLA